MFRQLANEAATQLLAIGLRAEEESGSLDQAMKRPLVSDSSKTLDDLVKEHVATIGENIRVRRWISFQLNI